MTIAVTVKISDGVVLAADSASTVAAVFPGGQIAVANVYNNANKLFNLRKDFPIGVVTWGAGAIGQTTTSTVLKDLRDRLSGKDPKHPDWKLSRDAYTVEDVAKKLRAFVFEELYVPAYAGKPDAGKPDVGFVVAGYSAGQSMADEYQVDIAKGSCAEPKRLRQQHETGVTWAGDPEALNRLLTGCSQGFLNELSQEFHIDLARLHGAVRDFQQRAQAQFVLPQMPLQDAIDVAEFLVETTIKFHQFKIGPPTVGGPIELAAISKHEGFRWVKRKYYFRNELNPTVETKETKNEREGEEVDGE